MSMHSNSMNSSEAAPAIGKVRNIKPRGRNAVDCSLHVISANNSGSRSRYVHREAVEKQRLKQRSFGYMRYDAQEIEDPINPIADEAASLSYSSNIDRFKRNVAEQAAQRKEEKMRREKAKIAHLTQERVQRDESRWAAMDTQYQRKQAHIAEFSPMKNNGSMPYNPITLRYDDSLDGKRLEFEDEKAIYRAKLRQKRLFEKQTSGYDPLTGTHKQFTNRIVKPQTPAELQHKPL